MSSGSWLEPPLQDLQRLCKITANDFADNANAKIRKRKHVETDQQTQHGIGEIFMIKRPPNGPLTKANKLVPKLLTSRSCLPLSYLDLNGKENGVAGTQVFTARVASLEANLQGNTVDQPLLIASSSTNNATLFAVERVDAGLYALCRLANWVTLEALEKLYISSQDRPSAAKRRRVQQDNRGKPDWWLPVGVEGAQNVKSKPDLGGNGAVRLSMDVPKSLSAPPIISIEQSSSGDALQDPGVSVRANELEEESLQPTLPNPVEALATIRAQYQEALYLSRSSLAYFAKGSLSRARAAASNDEASLERVSALIQYLRSSILTLALMDKKYKDALPGILCTLPAGTVSEDDIVTVVASIEKKGRKPKKDKVGKDGLYPGEQANIARWWMSRHDANPESSSPNTGQEEINLALLEQRARETQIQIILILETMALEATIPQPGLIIDDTNETVDNGTDTQSKKGKTKKPLHLATLLDILVDRLSIWQSMRIEDGKPSADKCHSEMRAIENADHLKSFCVDVVLPFYGARLPDITKMLCQKLGGPNAPSPGRPPLGKAASASHLGQKPDTSTQAPPQKKPRRTLERVLTEEKTSRIHAPALSRSATDSALPGLKREVSDTSLSTIPLNRVALQKSQRYSQREVDLRAVSQSTEAKLKKKAAVERELQGAIAALKRPNPRMAVKELVEAAEKRAAGSTSRKSKNPVRSLFAQGVQVTATPRGNRQKDVFGGLPRLPAANPTITNEPDEIPPSSISRVPSSVQRHPALPIKDNEPKLPRPYLQTTIEQTPTRGPSKQSKNPLGAEPKDRPYSVFVTPSKPRRSPAIISQQPRLPSPYAAQPSSSIRLDAEVHGAAIQDTPLKPQIDVPEKGGASNCTDARQFSPRSDVEPDIRANVLPTTIPSSPPVLEEESSRFLFETLGWDDYVDELA